MVLILENIGFFCHPGPGCRDPKANCKQSIESGHRRLETGGWAFHEPKNVGLRQSWSTRLQKKRKLGWGHHLEEAVAMAGFCTWETVTCCRLLALEALPGGGGGGDKLDIGAAAPATAKAQASATARTEAGAPHTEPTAQADAPAAAGVEAAAASTKAAAKTTAKAAAKAAATAVARGDGVRDKSCGERRENLVRPVGQIRAQASNLFDPAGVGTVLGPFYRVADELSHLVTIPNRKLVNTVGKGQC